MKYIVVCENSDSWDFTEDYSKAELLAKKRTAQDRDGDSYLVMQAVARVSAPAPEATVEKLI